MAGQFEEDGANFNLPNTTIPTIRIEQKRLTLDGELERSRGQRRYRDVANEVLMRQKILSALAEKKPPPFEPVFLTKTESQLEKQKEVAVENEKKSMFKDLPQLDDDEIVDYVSNDLTGKLLESKIFRTGIMAVIIANSLMIAIETNKSLEKRYSHIFTALDQCMMSIFVCEIMTKWYNGFWKFWTQGWNNLDFLIVASLLYGPLFLNNSSGSRGVLRILRVLRAFRSLRSMSSLPGLQIVVQTILQSIPDMANIVLLLVIIMLVFSVIGITIFKNVIPKHFGDLSNAMFSLFICLTQDGWVQIFEDLEKKEDEEKVGGAIYLICFIAIGAFIFANLIVAVVVTNLECAVLDVRKEEQQNAKEQDVKGLGEKEDEEKANIVSDESIPTRIFKKQEPLFIPDFTGLNVEHFENYVLIISAMEDNYASYLKMKEELIEILKEVGEVNESAQMVISGEQSMGSTARNSRSQISRMSGDIASGLMAMENSNLISSRDCTLSDMIQKGAEAYVQGKHQKRLERHRNSIGK